MIELIKIKCPNCGAILDIDSKLETAFCQYCGTKMHLNNTNRHEYIHRTIDESKMHVSDNDTYVRIKEMEHEEKSGYGRFKIFLICIGIGLACIFMASIAKAVNFDNYWLLNIIGFIAFITGVVYLIRGDKGHGKKKKVVDDGLSNYMDGLRGLMSDFNETIEHDTYAYDRSSGDWKAKAVKYIVIGLVIIAIFVCVIIRDNMLFN